MKTVKKNKPRKPAKSKAASVAGGQNYQWTDLTAKQNVFLEVMRDILRDPDLGEQYLKCDADAAQAFKDKGMDVPADVKVVFLPSGDSKKLPLGAGSAIIELPPRAQAGSPLTDKQLLELFDCTYHLAW